MLVLLAVLSVGVGWYMWHSYQDLQAAQTRNLRLEELSGVIAHLDEVLTMSARMGAATGDQRWEDRYNHFEPQLDAAIQEAKRLAPDVYGGQGATQTDTANVALVDMEQRAFDLVRAGLPKAATSLLFSPEYEEQKRIYSEGNDQLAASLHASGEASVASSQRQWIVAVLAEGVLLLVAISFAVLLSININRRTQAEVALRKQVRRDALTGVLNHGAIIAELRNLLSGDGDGALHAVAMIDVDGLKAVNDTYGHQTGDAVLTTVADALSRDGATVGRYGGDEFVALLPGADRAAAERYQDAAYQSLADAGLTDPESGANIPVSASIGLACYPKEADSIADLINLADNAMYASRRQRPVGPRALGRAGPLGSGRAAEMVGQIVPILTSPGQLEDKLRLVSQRICAGAGYDAVNIDIFDQEGEATRARHTFSRVPEEVVETWRSHRRRIEEEPILQEIRSSGRALIVDDPQNDERLTEIQRGVLRAAELRSAVVTPLFWGQDMIGALSVACKREAAFTTRDVEFLTAVADQVTAIARMANLVEEFQSTSAHLAQAREQTVLLLAAAAEAHDRTTGVHLQGIRALTEALAEELGYSEAKRSALGLASVLHDIGKVRVPDSILACADQLADEEWKVMQQHTAWGASFLADQPGFELAATVAQSHHERWDGGGYPDGLSGEAIPEPATIVAVADALDAMTHDRPYRARRPVDQAVQEVVAGSGTQFSPKVAAALQRLHQCNALPPTTAQAPDQQAAA